MIKLTYANVNDADFNDALEVIDRCTVLTVKTMCAFNKLKRAFDGEKKVARDLFTKIIDKYTEFETVGVGDKIETKPKIKKGPAGNDVRCLTDEAAMDKEAKELLEQPFEIQINPIPLSELAVAKLTPRQVRALAPVLVEEEEKVGPKLVSRS